MTDNILVTGCAGFIGSHLIDYLLKKKFNIFGLDLPGASFKNLEQYIDVKFKIKKQERIKFFKKKIQIPTKIENLKIIECDLNDNILLEKIIQDVKPRFIFHLGAQPLINESWEDPAYTIQTNVIGTINVFEPIKGVA